MNRYLQDILDQPETLQAVLDYCIGPGWEEIRSGAKILQKARRIVVTSMGSALYSCVPIHCALSRIHPNAQLVETAYRAATTHGLQPGEMRYLNWLVK